MERQKIKILGIYPSVKNWGILKGEMNRFGKINFLSFVDEKFEYFNGLTVNNNYEMISRKISYLLDNNDSDFMMTETPFNKDINNCGEEAGIAMGILASKKMPLITTSSSSLILDLFGKSTFSQEESIEWAEELFSYLDWEKDKNGKLSYSIKNKILVRTVSSVMSGISSMDFQKQVLGYWDFEKKIKNIKKK